LVTISADGGGVEILAVFRDGTDPGVDDFDDDAATDVHERDDALDRAAVGIPIVTSVEEIARARRVPARTGAGSTPAAQVSR
jgi:hypothetical protein